MARPWYADGVRFGCTKGGDCCHNHGEYDRVYFTAAEERKLARHLGLTLAEVRRRYISTEDGYRIARSRGGACIFLDGCRCSIYSVRPVPCRTWPFWPETMSAKRIFAEEVASFCKGVGRGRRRSHAEIRRDMEAKAQHDDELDDDL